MKPISVHVSPDEYQVFKSLAARTGRPVAELIREAMRQYLQRQRGSGASIEEIEPHDSGRMRAGWKRVDLFDEMTGGRP